MYDVFLSYSRQNAALTEQIRLSLERSGIVCFMDTERISGGDSYLSSISSAILDSRLFLFLASNESYQSEFTRKELLFAINNLGSQRIFPLIIDDSLLRKTLEFMISDIHCRKLSPSYQIEPELTGELKFLLQKQGVPQSRLNGTGKRKKRRGPLILALSCAGILVASLLFTLARERDRSNGLLYQKQIHSARQAVIRAQRIRLFPVSNESVSLEQDYLKEALLALSTADSLRGTMSQRARKKYSDPECDSLTELVMGRMDTLTLFLQQDGPISAQ